ncbi:MAG: SPOR domain-containing protein [Brachymonas sp.]|nr:SPOR domain-containing protein [Brachymonas sp.]
MFKKRSSKSDPSSAAPAPESAAAYADPLHRRARHRLIGASVLVVIAVLVLPWVFDVKPPTVSPNVPIAIEGQTDNTPVPPATATLPLAPVPTARATAEETDTQTETVAAKRKPDQAEPPAEPERTAKPQAKAKTEAARAKEPATRKPANIDELIAQRQKQERQEKQEKQKQQERAKPTPAKPTPAATTTPPPKPEQATPPVQYNFPEKGRFVVQIGAYVEADKVANVRKRLSQAGLNNYTQQVTINGKKVTRVRLGPFTSRKQMEQVANKVRALGLPVSLYQL